MTLLKEDYTRKVGGERYHYELEFTEGGAAAWSARVYEGGQLKGTPSGTLADNLLTGEALQQYLVAYVEGMIERGLDVAE